MNSIASGTVAAVVFIAALCAATTGYGMGVVEALLLSWAAALITFVLSSIFNHEEVRDDDH